MGLSGRRIEEQERRRREEEGKLWAAGSPKPKRKDNINNTRGGGGNGTSYQDNIYMKNRTNAVNRRKREGGEGGKQAGNEEKVRKQDGRERRETCATKTECVSTREGSKVYQNPTQEGERKQEGERERSSGGENKAQAVSTRLMPRGTLSATMLDFCEARVRRWESWWTKRRR